MRRVFSGMAAAMVLAAKSGWDAAMRRGPVLWLTLSGALLVAGIFAVTAMAIGEFRERTLANREREMENTVQLIARHFDQQFEDSDIVAADLIGQINLPEITSPAMFRERMSGSAANEMLRGKVSAVSYLGDIAIYDADGELINWSRSQPLPKINISTRTYFQAFKSNPMSEPVLVESVRSFIIGKWTMIVARRLNLPDGTFVGAQGQGGLLANLGNSLNSSYGNQGNLAYNTQAGIGNANAAADLARGAAANNVMSAVGQGISLGTKLLGFM